MLSCGSTLVKQMDTSQELTQQMETCIKQNLQDLSHNIAAEKPHHEQMTAIREARATIQEQLKVTETALQNARMESAIVKTREEATLHRIAALGDHVLQMKAEPATESMTPEIFIRLHDLENRNKEISDQSNALRSDLAAVSSQLRQKDEALKSEQCQLSTLQSQLGEKQAEYAAAQHQQCVLREQVAAQHQEASKQLIDTANDEKAIFNTKLADMRKQLEEAQNKTKEVALESSEELHQRYMESIEFGRLLKEKSDLLCAADANITKEVSRRCLKSI